MNALKEQLEAQKIGNKTGLTPANPEVEFGYLWGSPAVNGNRKDVSLQQTFDFPTAYVHRGKLSDLQNNSAACQYASERMDLMLSAKKVCIELVYYNALRQIYARQLGNAAKIASAQEKMNKTGETNRLEYNKAMINYANMENEVRRIDIERQRLQAELTALNGGQPIPSEGVEISGVVRLGLYGLLAHRVCLLEIFALKREIVGVIVQHIDIVRVVFSSRILPFSQSRSHGRTLRNSVLRIEPVRNIARIALLRGHVAELHRFGRSAHSISTTSSGVRTWSYSFVRSRETFRLSGATIWLSRPFFFPNMVVIPLWLLMPVSNRILAWCCRPSRTG